MSPPGKDFFYLKKFRPGVNLIKEISSYNRLYYTLLVRYDSLIHRYNCFDQYQVLVNNMSIGKANLIEYYNGQILWLGIFQKSIMGFFLT